MAISAVFFPVDPESCVYDLINETRAAMLAGLRLYTNGRQFALLPKPVKGWALFAAKFNPNQEQPCVV